MTTMTIDAGGTVEPHGGGEEVRLVVGFTDVFAAIVLAVAASALAATGSWIGGPVLAAAAWLLSVPFVRRRHFAASAIVLTVAFAGGVAITFGLDSVFALFAAAAGCGVYWMFFRVPIAIALAIITVVAAVTGVSSDAMFGHGGAVAALIAGVILFAAAMAWDVTDRDRTTRRADVAFWLHLVAAPLIVHGLFTLMGATRFYSGGGESVAGVFALFAVFLVTALIIDRRSILIASFSYLLGATAWVIGRTDFVMGGGIAALVTGTAVLVLAAGWYPLRARLLSVLPDGATRRVPPASRGPVPPQPDEAEAARPSAEREPVRLFRGLDDYFVAIGMTAVFVGSLAIGYAMNDWSGAFRAASYPKRAPFDIAPVWAMLAVPAVALWACAEYFVRYRRMAWPAIVGATLWALLTIAAGVAIAVTAPLHGTTLSGETALPRLAFGNILTATVVGSIVAALANLAFWWRQRVPMSFAWALTMLFPVAFADVVLRLFTVSVTGGNFSTPDWAWRSLAAGLAAAAIAIAWDRADRARMTPRSDTAFWLHVVASLFAVPAAFTLAAQAMPPLVATLLVSVALVAWALVTDRKVALIVALPLVIGLARSSGVSESLLPVLGVSASLLALLLQWETVRQALRLDGGRDARLDGQPAD